MKTTIATFGLVAMAALAARGGDVRVVLDSTDGSSAFQVLDQASNALLDVQSGTVLRLGREPQPNQLDQQQWDYTYFLWLDSETGKVWQSFTTGLNGRLSRIAWWNNYYGTYVATGLIRIRAGEGDSGTILWSKVVTWDDYSPPIDVDSNIVVSTGDVLTVEVLGIGEVLKPGYAEGDVYAGGRSSEGTNIDFMFATYVTPRETNPTMVSIPSGNLGVGVEPEPASERLTVAGNAAVTGRVTAASFAGNGSGLTNIGSSALAAGAVTSSKIASGAVQGSNLATFAVTSNKILWGEVHTEALADGAVTADKIAAGAVGYPALADHSITSIKIASNAVGPAELNDQAVEARALASAAVGTAALHDNAVTTAKLTNNAVTAAKLADGTCLAELADDDGVGSGLDADLLDGEDSASLVRVRAGGLVPVGATTNFLPPHFVPFTLQLASENPYFGGVAQIVGFENDSHVSIAFTAYNGADGTSTNGGAKGSYGDGTNLLQFGSTNYRYDLRCRGPGLVGLELSTTGSVAGAYYRLIY